MDILDAKKLAGYTEESCCADIESGNVGGIAVAVMQNGATVYQGCFGDDRIRIKYFFFQIFPKIHSGNKFHNTGQY